MAILRDPVKRLVSDYTHERLLHNKVYPLFDELIFDSNGNVNMSNELVQVKTNVSG